MRENIHSCVDGKLELVLRQGLHYPRPDGGATGARTPTQLTLPLKAVEVVQPGGINFLDHCDLPTRADLKSLSGLCSRSEFLSG